MKRILMTLVAVLAIMGYGFSQETHWPEFNLYQYDDNAVVIAFIQVDGEYITPANYEDIEVGAFVNGEIRGHAFMVDETDLGDPYPYLELYVYFDNTNEPVTFTLYNHATGQESTLCEASIEILTGTDHNEMYFDYDATVILSFTMGEEPVLDTFTLDVTGYTAEKDHYYLIATPIGAVNASDVADLMINDYDFFSFDQSGEGDDTYNYLEWIDHNGDASFQLEPGVGYLYANSEDVTLTFTGTAYDTEDHNMTVTLSYDGDANFPGWNLLGNPFGVEAYPEYEFYVMNEDGSEIIASDEYEVAPMQGFFVVAEEDGETMDIQTVEGGVGKVKRLAVNVTRGRGVVDRAIVRFGEGRQLPKIQMNANSTKVYVPQGNEDYAVVYSEGMGELPVNFKAESNGTYGLSINSDAQFAYLHLIDNLTGADVDLLATPSYSFEANTTDYASRFKLVFVTGDNSDENFAFFSNGNFIISNEGEAVLQVVDVNGRILSSENISGCASVNVKAAAGVYMLRLVNGDNVKVQKVVVK